MLKPAAAIQFAILSRESLPVRGGEDLYADYQLTSAQRMHVAIYRADSTGSPLRSWSLDAKDDLPHRFHWDKTLAGAPAAPGTGLRSMRERADELGLNGTPAADSA